VEGNERAAAVRRRELLPVVDGEVVGRPVRGKRGDGRSLAGARSDRLATVAAIFRRQDELLLAQIEVAIRPAKVGAAFQLNKLFRRLVGALLGGVERAPVLAQLVPSVLGREILPAESNAMPSPLRSPVAKRSAAEKRWPVRLAS
jgi:hypothetical protein